VKGANMTNDDRRLIIETLAEMKELKGEMKEFKEHVTWIPLKFVTTFCISLYYKEIAQLLYFIVVTKYVTTINS
jgi:hypothetical protein